MSIDHFIPEPEDAEFPDLQDCHDDLSIPEREGADARSIGVPIEHNPYERDTDEYEAWERGWESPPIPSP